jgi:hypothetical protein
MAVHQFDPGDEEAFDKMREFFSPAQVDQLVRQVIHFCWMMLPRERRNVDEVERQVRRMVDRALKDLRDDQQAFWAGLDG